jgi:hypothetical protein
MAELRAALYYVPGTSTTLKFKVLKTKGSFWCPETDQFVPVQSSSVQCTSVESIPKMCVLILFVKEIIILFKTNNQEKNNTHLNLSSSPMLYQLPLNGNMNCLKIISELKLKMKGC